MPARDSYWRQAIEADPDGHSSGRSSCKRIVICGGGAIGAAVAYFTSRRGALPIVIERHAVAGAASGKSGGFLALDWCSGSPLIDWRGGASSSMPSFPPSSAILGDIGV